MFVIYIDIFIFFFIFGEINKSEKKKDSHSKFDQSSLKAETFIQSRN